MVQFAVTQKRLLLPGETIGYARKSTDDEGAGKSLDDQTECILETAEAWSILLARDDIKVEKAGLSGCLWWDGGGASGIDGDTSARREHRPVLTEIVRSIVAGQVKCIIVWSLDRLWRDVGICEAMIQLLAKNGCLLYDRNGPVDISTPEGRTSVRSNAVAAANLREMAAVNAPRGVQRSRKKGKLITNADRLGFRTIGGGSGKVIHLEDEQRLVVRIFTMYVVEGLTHAQIATQLTKENVPWYTDAHPLRRNYEGRPRIIYPCSVLAVLKDCRYQGRQKYGKTESVCPAFLRDNGEPVVPVALFEAAQAKLEYRPRGKRGTSKYTLSSLLYCGICGQPFNAARSKLLDSKGKKHLVGTYTVMHQYGTTAQIRWCTHEQPTLQRDRIDAYIDDHLAPLLLAEVNERMLIGDNLAIQNERSAVARDLTEAERRRNEEMPKYLGKVSPELLADMEHEIVREITGLQRRVYELDVQLRNMQEMQQKLVSLGSLSPSARNDVMQAVVRWVAVVPSNLPHVRLHEPGVKKSQRRPNPDQGRLVFLTTWGAFHTAVIFRDREMIGQRFTCYLREATFEETITSVCQLPDVDAFIKGLQRTYDGRRKTLKIEEVAPGWRVGVPSQPAVFEETPTSRS